MLGGLEFRLPSDGPICDLSTVVVGRCGFGRFAVASRPAFDNHNHTFLTIRTDYRVLAALPRRTPPRSAFTRRELRVIDSLRTPRAVQQFLREFPYNWMKGGVTMRTFRGVLEHGEAHCLEAVLFAATVLDQHGYPPIVLDIESQDGLDHVLFLYRHRGLWGTVARSRDYGLHGRKPVFRSIRELVATYAPPFVDGSGRVIGFGTAHLDALVKTDWRLSRRNNWEVERELIRMPHSAYRMNEREYLRLLRQYAVFKASGAAQTRAVMRRMYGKAVKDWL